MHRGTSGCIPEAVAALRHGRHGHGGARAGLGAGAAGLAVGLAADRAGVRCVRGTANGPRSLGSTGSASSTGAGLVAHSAACRAADGGRCRAGDQHRRPVLGGRGPALHRSAQAETSAGVAPAVAHQDCADARGIRRPCPEDSTSVRPRHPGPGAGLDRALCRRLQRHHWCPGPGFRPRTLPKQLRSFAGIALLQHRHAPASGRLGLEAGHAAGRSHRKRREGHDRPRCGVRWQSGAARAPAGGGPAAEHRRRGARRAPGALPRARPAQRAGPGCAGGAGSRTGPRQTGGDGQHGQCVPALAARPRLGARRTGRPPHVVRRRLAWRARPRHGAGVDRIGRHGQPRQRQRALQPPAEVSAPAGAAGPLPAGRDGHRGLLEERGLAAAEPVHRRASGGAVFAAAVAHAVTHAVAHAVAHAFTSAGAAAFTPPQRPAPPKPACPNAPRLPA